MLIKEFEKQLKEIDSNFEVRDINKDDIKGIYWSGHCAYITVPHDEIFEEKNPSFTDMTGHVHRTSGEALDMARNFLLRLDDAEFKDLITTTDEQEGVK